MLILLDQDLEQLDERPSHRHMNQQLEISNQIHMPFQLQLDSCP